MKRAILVIAIVIALFAGAPCQDAKAEWLSCTVNSFGQWWDLTVVNLTDQSGAFTYRWFVAYEGKSKEMLATAMYAFANNKKITIYVPSTAQYTMIVTMNIGM